MYNWSVDIKQLKKHKKQYAIWQIEQLVNFGLNGKKINKIELKKYWPELKLDGKKKKLLSMVLWPKK